MISVQTKVEEAQGAALDCGLETFSRNVLLQVSILQLQIQYASKTKLLLRRTRA